MGARAGYQSCQLLEQLAGLEADRAGVVAPWAPQPQHGARRVLKLVVRANARQDKSAVLLRIREEVEELKVLLRLCHDARAFASFASFEHAVTRVTDIARQNEGRLKSRRGRGQNRRVMPDGLAGPSAP